MESFCVNVYTYKYNSIHIFTMSRLCDYTELHTLVTLWRWIVQCIHNILMHCFIFRLKKSNLKKSNLLSLQGSACNDFCALACCGPCAVCQMQRELDNMGVPWTWCLQIMVEGTKQPANDDAFSICFHVATKYKLLHAILLNPVEMYGQRHSIKFICNHICILLI